MTPLRERLLIAAVCLLGLAAGIGVGVAYTVILG